MSVTARSGETYYALTSGARAGAVGSITLGLEWPDNTVAVAPSTAGIVESASGSYTGTRTAPVVTEQTTYVIVWYDPITDTSVTEDLTVLPGATPAVDLGAQALRRRARYKQRTVTGMAFELGYTYGLDDEAVPTGTVSVNVINAAGVSVHAGPAVVDPDIDDRYTVALSAATFPAVDVYAIVWTADVSGAPRTDITVLDVCASRLFTISAMYASLAVDLDGALLATYTPERIEAERIAAEDFIEAATMRAYAMRYYEARINRAEWYITPGIQMPHHDVQALRAVVIDGTAVSTDDLTDYVVGDGGFVYSPVDHCYVNLTIAYEHGCLTPDADRAAFILARHRLVHGPLDDRATSIAVEGGGSINLLTPGVRGSVTGIPEVDSFLQRYSTDEWVR